MISHFTRYALIFVFILFSAVFFADFWYQKNQDNSPQVSLTEEIETVQQICHQYSCADGSQFGRVTILAIDLLHFPIAQQQRLDNNQIVMVSNDQDEQFAYAKAKNSQFIIRYGPFLIGNSNAMFWYTSLFYLILAVAIFAGLFPLFREMAKLKKSAENFSQSGELSVLPTGKSAFFNPVNTAFAAMTTKIAQLLALQKELSDTLSHEIRTPLSRIRFAKEALNNNNIDDFKNEMELDLDEMESLVEEYLSYSRLEHEKPELETELQSPVAIVEKHVVLFNKYTKRQVGLVLDCSTNIAIEFNEKNFSRAVKNLIDNACKYSNSEVLVTIKDNADNNTDNNKLLILIEDDGPGIKAQHIDDLFLPYTRIKGENVSGFGLGLAITRKIIIWHKGTISVSPSKSLGGACFCIEIPHTE
ncbi:sensor histidine kinase [Thalassotalea sp. ND16A]|uniref:sensor histidine kinase n=1 Tax=Thalassotalea sp. ND16A TaxID=1535422 RepID=UPI00051A2665|nr:ATP-binding protein [Thalassotalea sp. ND16A]KGJ90526.1 hypothetical protein ND16A_1922 [Thalassotalea sp. ND16A]